MTNDPDELLREAEDEIEAWLCELDETWTATLADAEREAARRIDAAVVEAQARAEVILAEANREAGEALVTARSEAQRIVAEAGRLAAQRLLDADAEFERLRAVAAEHADAIRALADADVVAARGVDDEQLSALREAVQHLRTELSRVVDAAFDALPAVEATADALDRALGEDDQVIDVAEPQPVGAGPVPARPGRLRRLLRLRR